MPTMNDETLHERYQRETAGDFARLEASIAERDAEIARLNDVLLRNGFVPCDIPACNCGSWHARYGLRERFDELTEDLSEAGHPLSNENGNLARRALGGLVAERDRLRAELAVAHEWLTHLAKWIDSYWQDGMRPDEWTMKEWAQKSRAAIKGEA